MTAIRTVARYGPLLGVLALSTVAAPWLRAGYRPLRWTDLVEALALLPLAAAAGLLMARRPRSLLGPLMAAIAVLLAVADASDAAVWRAVARDEVSDSVRWLAIVNAVAFLIAVPVAITFPVLLLPDGRLPSRRWRPVAWAAGVAIAAYLVGLFGAGEGRIGDYPFESPAMPPVIPHSDIIGAIGWFGILAGAVAAVVSVVVRWLRRRPAERAALAAVLGAGVLPTVAVLLLTVIGKEQSRVTWLPWLVCLAVLWPASLVAAALMDGPDTPPLLARRLVLSALSAGGLLCGLATAGAVGLMVGRSEMGVAGGIGAALLTVLALMPLGQMARRRAVRLLYGDRDTPAALHARLAQRVHTADEAAYALRAALADLRGGLRLSYAGVHLAGGGVLASDGRLVEPAYDVALAAYGAPQGRLVVGARAPGEAFIGFDIALLDDLAPHFAAMAYGALLLEELRRSRTQIVLAREEERRRLRRDLHDGLGAAIAGIGFGLDAAALALADESSGRVRALRARVTEVQAELRRIVDGLRPSILDTSGLAEAVRADVRSRGNGETQLSVEIETTELGPLPAGVELAAYRVVQEAVTNALRHARAPRVTVRLGRDPERLRAVVEDDGIGIHAGQPPGVGLASMAERAAEVGGAVTVVAPVGGGTVVTASFPVPSQQDGTGGPVPADDRRP